MHSVAIIILCYLTCMVEYLSRVVKGKYRTQCRHMIKCVCCSAFMLKHTYVKYSLVPSSGHSQFFNVAPAAGDRRGYVKYTIYNRMTVNNIFLERDKIYIHVRTLHVHIDKDIK